MTLLMRVRLLTYHMHGPACAIACLVLTRDVPGNTGVHKALKKLRSPTSLLVATLPPFPLCYRTSKMSGLVSSLVEKFQSLTSSEPSKAPVQEPAADDVEKLRDQYKQAGQQHVFTFYDELDAEGKAQLYDQLDQLKKPDEVNKLFEKINKKKDDDEETKEPSIEPLPAEASASLLEAQKDEIDDWYTAGLGLIADNKVGVVLMAGGQGTRLGSSDPKGCFDIGLPSHKSLFQMQGERILKIQELAQKQTKKESTPTVPWYVMTSGPTRGPTEKYFKDNNYFGLSPENVIIFEQGVLPCISNEGKILMESKGKVRSVRSKNINC